MSDKHSLSILNDSIFERSGESTSSSLAPPLQEDGMSEKVQNMADSVYREFERMIAQYGEGVLKDLMPLIVAILENLETVSRDKRKMEVDGEMLKVDNEQLIAQYEKERGMRRTSEQSRRLKQHDSFKFSRRTSKTHVPNEAPPPTTPPSPSSSSSSFINSQLPSTPQPTSLAKTQDNVEAPTQAPADDTATPADSKRLLSIDRNLRKSLIGDMNKEHQLTYCDEDSLYEAQMRPYDEDQEPSRDITDEQEVPNNEEEEEEEVEDELVLGVSKEIEGLIRENEELLQTKHALNIVKDDLIARVDELTGEKEILSDELEAVSESRERLRSRLNECEEAVRNLREQVQVQERLPEEEALGTPGQRKRFTRVEMARVLMERNLYKEKLMELQEAVRWAEMIRATKHHVQQQQQQHKTHFKSSVWNFFGNLFSKNDHNNHNNNNSHTDLSTVHYHNSHNNNNNNNNTGLNSFMNEQAPPIVIREKSLATLFQDKNRVQAYGWSLPARYKATLQRGTGGGSEGGEEEGYMEVAVPITSKPLINDAMLSKTQCAVGVVWRPGRTGNSKSLNASATAVRQEKEEEEEDDDEVEMSQADKKRKSKLKKTASSSFPSSYSSSSSLPFEPPAEVNVWICVIDQTGSHVVVLDVGSDGEMIEKFNVCTANVTCMTHVPGFEEVREKIERQNEEEEEDDEEDGVDDDNKRGDGGAEGEKGGGEGDGEGVVEGAVEATESSTDLPCRRLQVTVVQVEEDDELKHTNLLGKLHRRLSRSASRTPPRETPSLVSQATVWVGSIAGNLYVFSAAPYSRKRLHLLKLPDSVLSISHSSSKVFVTMANGSVACFSRASNSCWNMKRYVLLQLSAGTKGAIRSSVVVDDKFLWLSVGNLIHVVLIKDYTLVKSFSAHPRQESHVREMVVVGEGVWLVLRNESTLHLFHSSSHQPLQDVDIEPCISQLLGASYLGYSLVQISCLMAMQGQLWVGTGNGVVLRMPLSDTFDNIQATLSNNNNNVKTPGSVVRVLSDKSAPQSDNLDSFSTSNDNISSKKNNNISSKKNNNISSNISNNKFMPYCSLTGSHVSLHGCKEAVKFLLHVPVCKASNHHARNLYRKFSNPLPFSTPPTPLPTSHNQFWVVCGGEGYVALKREDTDTNTAPGTPNEDRSHLLVWQVDVPSSINSPLS